MVMVGKEKEMKVMFALMGVVLLAGCMPPSVPDPAPNPQCNTYMAEPECVADPLCKWKPENADKPAKCKVK